MTALFVKMISRLSTTAACWHHRVVSKAVDDSGVGKLAVLKALSVFQLRAHFFIYLLVNQLFAGSKFNLAEKDDCKKMEIFIPMETYEAAMSFSEVDDSPNLPGRRLSELEYHQMVLPGFTSGLSEFVRLRAPSANSAGIIVGPTLRGAELFLWGIGYPNASGRELLSIDVTGQEILRVKDGAQAISDLN